MPKRNNALLGRQQTDHDREVFRRGRGLKTQQSKRGVGEEKEKNLGWLSGGKSGPRIQA